GCKVQRQVSVRPGRSFVLGRQLALVTGLRQRKAGAWLRAGEAAGSVNILQVPQVSSGEAKKRTKPSAPPRKRGPAQGTRRK
ncbi:hypothetical protein DVA78_20235, partial [Acinetobacter baumannii]